MKRIAILTLKYSLILSLFLCIKLNVHAQAPCSLLKGDIVINGYDMADDQNNGTLKDDRFSFVVLKKVNLGQVIYFTDFGYINATNQFQVPSKAVSDGIIKWTADQEYEAGTEIIINCKFTLKATLKDNITAAGTVVGALESYNTSTLFTGDPKEYMSLAEFSGDQIFAFLLPSSNGVNDFTTGITFLAGISANVSSGGWITGLSPNLADASISELPAQLNTGAQNLILSYNNGDNTDGFTNDGFAGRHKNKITNTAAAIVADANTPANWEYASNFYPDPNFVPLLTAANYSLSPLTIGTIADRLNICRGTSTTFTAVTTNACSYQWQMRTPAGTFANITNGGIFTNVTTNTLNISNVTTVDGNFFRLLVNGNGGIQTSNEAKLTAVNPVISLTAATFPNGLKNIAYPNQTIAVTSGGVAPYNFTVTSGSLPTGLSIDATTGIISGTPTTTGTFNFIISATSACTSTGAQSYSILIKEILIAPASLTDPTVGQAYSPVTLSATGGVAPYTYAVSAGALPAGLTLSAAGVLSGTPTAVGNFNFTIRATDAAASPGPYSGTISYSITTAAPTVAITPVTLLNPRAGLSYSQTVAASGGTAPYIYSISSGTLPGGLSLNTTTGEISGKPTATGSFNFAVRAFDSSTGAGVPYAGTRAYSITVAAPVISVIPLTLPNTTVGLAYASQTITALDGTAPYTYAITSGALPAGLSLAANGTLSGTATAGGNFNFTVTATDATTGGTYTGSRAYALVVNTPTIAIVPITLPSSSAGVIYNRTITASGGTAGYTFTVVSGTLPTGLSLALNGTLSGTANATGTFNFIVTATDASTGTGPYTGSRAYTLVVTAPTITITTASLNAGTVGTAYSQTLSAGGGTAPYTYAVTAGSLPAGLSLTTNGTLSGTARAGGVFNFTITATDATTGGTYTGSMAYTLTMNVPTIAVSPPTIANATVGLAYSPSTLTASGGTAPYTYAVTAGTLPAGLSLASNGTLSGTATAGGTFNFTVTATDASAGSGPYTGSRAYNLTVNTPTINISPVTFLNGTAGVVYTPVTVTASGGTAPYVYTITSGALPAGLSLTSAGALSGTPTASGVFTFTIRATDASAGTGPYTGARAYSLTIAAPTITIAPATLASATMGSAYNQTVSASGGTAPYTYTIVAGSLPAGLTLNSAGLLSGTPTVSGNFPITIKAVDQTGGVGPFSISNFYTLLVQFLPKITSATYDASTGVLVVNGTGFPPAGPADISKLIIKANGFTYPLTASTVSNSSATSFTVTLTAADQLAIMLNKNGTTGADGITYNLSANLNWFSTAPADATGGTITVSNLNQPSITSAVYNASTSVLTVSGTNFKAYPGAGNDIAVNKLTITAESTTYTLTSSDVELTNATTFSVTLNVADKLALKSIINKNGTQSTDLTLYNLAAAEDWMNAADAAAIIADLTLNGITVNNVAVPAITSASYQASTGILTVTGTNFLSLSGAANDIVASKFTITGEGSTTYTLTNTPNVDITSATIFTLTLSSTDQAGLNYILNKNGTSSTGGTVYNLAAGEDWAAGADAALAVADVNGNGITVSTVAVPAITSAIYDVATGQLVVSGTGFLFLNGPLNDVVANRFSFTGQGGTIYTLTNTPNVDLTSATEFTLSLSTADKAAIKPLLNKNGTSSIGGTAYNLAAAEDWAAGADAALVVADLVNPLTAVNALSTNADLSGLATSAGSLNPTFVTATTAYNVSTNTTTSTATVTATLADLTANMQVNVNGGGYAVLNNNTASGNLPLNFGNNIITIKVTAEDGSVKTYTLTINRPNASQTITFASTVTTAYGTTDFDPGASSATSAINPITYSSSNAAVATIVGGKIHIVGLGNTNITASQAGSIGFDAAPDVVQVLTVVKGTASIALSNLSQIYDGTTKAATATTTPVGLSGLSITYDGSATVPTAAGTYAVVASLNNTNYTAPDATGSLVIAPKAITVTADAKSKTYGSADPALTYTVAAGSLVGADAFTGALNRVAGENVGTYAINQNTLSAGANYAITYASANLSIGTKAITVTADAKSKTYGSADPALTYTVAAGSLVGADAFTGALNRVAGENVGTYAINQNTLSAGANYAITYAGANLSIGTKAITVTADAKS
uniref:putative Ig domain-containing protein n=1 Tax=Pedobacter nototheniae TaxID=2488994 RepID=UPI00292DD1E0